MGSPTSLLEAALAYAVLGWTVFPLRGKLPAISKDDGGRGYLDATTDAETIRTWWTDDPRANIGIATRASGLLVLDVDPRNCGAESLAALERKHGPLPVTPEVATGSGDGGRGGPSYPIT